MKIKVLSLNIACFIPLVDKSDLLKKIVEKEKPDILCLQEVARNLLQDTEEYNQIHKIAELLGTAQYHGNLCNPYIITEEYRKNDSCYHGCATYILNPNIRLVSHTDIPVDRSDKRFVIDSSITYQGKDFHVINLHLEAKARKEETKIILDYLNDNDWRVIVFGDLNSFGAEEGQDVDSDLRKVMTDVWDKLEGGRAVTSYGSQWWYKNFPENPHTVKIESRESNYPDGNLDYFFCKNITPLSIKSLSEPVPYLSDHLALVAEFNI